MQEGALVGRRVGRYVLVERLGGGGMGEVFRATDRLGVEVALKRLALSEGHSEIGSESHERARDDAAMMTEPATAASAPIALGIVPAAPLARPLAATLGLALAREFRALSSLRHPNVVEVLDYGFDGARPFFTMQLLEGGVPITVATRGATFERKADLFAQLLRAVRYIHGRGVLHRDISASNVVVAGDTVKVLDFGLAVVREERDPRLARWGTRGYRAPELESGGAPSRRSDLYAIGMIGREIFGGDERLQGLLAKLTSDDPRERSDDAGAVLVELARVTGIALPVDTHETLDSALTTVSLVGRDRELALLDDALSSLVVDAAGSALRIEGESGIGKSRLLDELRTRALVAGCLVLEGQSREEGGGPYEAFSGIVRGLALEVDVDARDAHALAPVVDLRSRDGAANDIKTDPDSVSARIFDAVAGLLARVHDADRRRVVVLLEDLQWASDDVLLLVRRLAELARTMPLLVVASHREGDVARALADLSCIRLERIAEHDARELVRIVLGDAPADLADRLARESEGHPLFLVELLRRIAEHGANIEVPEAIGVPQRIAAIVRSRLLGMTASHRELFEIAAVVGRSVDVALVGAIYGTDSATLDSWVRAGLAAGLFEIRSERVRFTHDKIREGIIQLIGQAELRLLHRRAGEALEKHARDPNVESAALAHHFTQAGDWMRTARWARIAGERAFAVGANAIAIRLFADALHAMSETGDRDRVLRARLLRLSGIAHARIGNYPKAHEHGLAALNALGHAPRTAPVRIAQTMKDIAKLVVRRRPKSSSREIDELTLAHYLVAETALFRDAPGDMVWFLIRAVALAEGATPDTQINVYSSAGFAAGTTRLDRLAAHWHARAFDIAKRVGSPAMVAASLHRCAVCAVVRADWDEADDLLARASETATRAGDRRQWQETTTVQGLAASYRGDDATAAELLAEVHESAKRNGDRQGTLWGGTLSALCHLRIGDATRAAQLLAEAEPCIDQGTSIFDRINFHGTRALHLFGAGERDAAIREATGVIDRLEKQSISAYWLFHGLAAAQDTLLAAAETEDDRARKRALLEVVARGCKEGRRLAMFCVFARSSLSSWRRRMRET